MAYTFLVLICTPALVYPLVGTLEWPYPPVEGTRHGSDGLIVLAGGLREPDRLRLKAELSDDTLDRCLLAAELYHDGGPCPVIVTGGVLDPKSKIPPVAPVMRELLVRLGVRDCDVVVEPRARTTYESAIECRKLVEARGLRHVLLVTDAVHMGRSLRCFRKQGLDLTPAACGHRATEFKLRIDSFIPSAEAARNLSLALHEWLGLAWYRLSGKI